MFRESAQELGEGFPTVYQKGKNQAGLTESNSLLDYYYTLYILAVITLLLEAGFLCIKERCLWA